MSAASADALGDAYTKLRALIGTEGPTTRARVRGRDFARFARAADDANPIYVDDEAARAAGYPAAVAPPVFLSSVQEWGVGLPQREMRPDGTGSERTGWLPLDGLRLMGGGQDLELHKPAFDGDELVITCRLDDVTLKNGRSGPLLLLALTTTYRDAAGEAVVTCRETPIVRGA